MAVKNSKTGYSGLFPNLQVKTRVFVLTSNRTPIRHMIAVKHTGSKPLTYNDSGLNRALRWATNQISPFVDEQDGLVTLSPIVFTDGKLIVESSDQNLQKFLMIHPSFGVKFEEFDKEKDANEEVQVMAGKLDAQIAAKDLDINDLEAIARVVLKGKGSISTMTSSELKRDMIIWAGNNSEEFMDLLNDENLKLRNLAVRAVEMNILSVKSDNRTVVWGDKKSQKVIVVPYGENVYSGLALFFKTDEGLDVLQKITNSL
tara:strand:- start:3562 stop:4338 length:777 start_codon:yes stop_codon:yes gene_type:complete